MMVRFLFFAAFLISGCATSFNAVTAFDGVPVIEVQERGETYTIRHRQDWQWAMIVRHAPAFTANTALHYGQRKLDIPELEITPGRVQKNNAKRALKKGLPENCAILKSGDGSSVMQSFDRAGRIYFADIICQ